MLLFIYCTRNTSIVHRLWTDTRLLTTDRQDTRIDINILQSNIFNDH